MSVKVELQYLFYRERMKLPALPRSGDRIEATEYAIQKVSGAGEGTKFRVNYILFVPGFDYVIVKLEIPR